MISRQGELRYLSRKEEKAKLTILLYHTGKASHFRRANSIIPRNHFIIVVFFWVYKWDNPATKV